MDILNSLPDSYLHTGSTSLSYLVDQYVEQLLDYLPQPYLHHLVLERDIPSICTYLALLKASSTFSISDLANYQLVHSASHTHCIQYCLASTPIVDPALYLAM